MCAWLASGKGILQTIDPFLAFGFQVAQHLPAELGRHERVLGLLLGRRPELARGPGQAGQAH